jgi:hypothetical protein
MKSRCNIAISRCTNLNGSVRIRSPYYVIPNLRKSETRNQKLESRITLNLNPKPQTMRRAHPVNHGFYLVVSTNFLISTSIGFHPSPLLKVS